VYLFSGNPFEIFSFMGLTYYQIASIAFKYHILLISSSDKINLPPL